MAARIPLHHALRSNVTHVMSSHITDPISSLRPPPPLTQPCYGMAKFTKTETYTNIIGGKLETVMTVT